MDPFVELIRLLRPRATLWTGLEGAGQWGVSFRKRDDTLFCWLERGACQLTRPGHAPVRLRANDFVLVRTTTPFALTSDPTLEPEDSEKIVAATKDPRIRVGTGKGKKVVLRAGKLVFDARNEELLAGLLPSFVHVSAAATSSWRVRSLMEMNRAESLKPGAGSEFVLVRLMELLFAELLRSAAHRMDATQSGLLAGLADPVTARALLAMHGDVAHGWTVAALARLCGVSRSSFAARFHAVVGTGPIEHLHQWRMALAKDALGRGTQSIGEIALAIGFQSTSAFSTAFRRTVGVSPRRFTGGRPR